MGDIYRRSASIVVFRPIADKKDPDQHQWQVLLVHKPRKRDAWQLPQGGLEGLETVMEAAARELSEEAGLKAEILGESQKFYQYDFPASYRRFRPDQIKGQRIGFVFGKVATDAVVTVDNVEINSYKWVAPKEIGRFVRRPEYRELVDALVSEGLGLVRSM